MQGLTSVAFNDATNEYFNKNFPEYMCGFPIEKLN